MADRDSANPPVPPPPPAPPVPRPASSPTSPRARALHIWRKIVRGVTARFPVKFAALALALALWIMVSAEEPTEAWVDVRVQLITDSAVSLVGEIPEVEALVAGRGRELLKLYTSRPEIRRVVSSDTPNEVTLDLRPGDVIIPGNADVRVRDVTPRAISLNFAVTEQRHLPVRALVHLITDSTMRVISGPRVQPGSVLVKGPRRAVRGLGSLTTDRLNIFVRDSVIIRSAALDTTGLGLTAVVPPEVRIRINAERVPPPQPSVALPTGTVPANGAPPSGTPTGAQRGAQPARPASGKAAADTGRAHRPAATAPDTSSTAEQSPAADAPAESPTADSPPGPQLAALDSITGRA